MAEISPAPKELDADFVVTATHYCQGLLDIAGRLYQKSYIRI
jgi:hypothetical protein